MPHISDAKYLDGYRLRFVFDNGREGIADLSPMIVDDPRPVFATLRDEAVFRQFFIERGVLCWPCDLDIAPEYLYFLVFRDDPNLRGLFGAWGYINAEVAV